MKRDLGKRLMVFTLAAAFFAQMVSVPVSARAATSKGNTTVSTQEGLNKALNNQNKTTINVRSDEQQVFTMKSTISEGKTLNANTTNANFKDYATFKFIRLYGSNNTFYNYTENPCISMYADASKLIVAKGSSISTLKVKGNNNNIKMYENASIKNLVFDKVAASLNIMTDGQLGIIYMKQTSNLELSGAAQKVILKSYGKNSKVTSSVPMEARFYQDAKITLNSGAEGSVLKVNEGAMITLTNLTTKAATIVTPTETIVVETGETMSSSGEEESKEQEDTTTGTIGGIGGFIGGSSSGDSTPTVVLTKMELDSDTASLSNTDKTTKTVTISTYITGDQKINYISSNSQVDISLVSATLPDGYYLSSESVANNAKKYYTVEKEKVTFLSEGLLTGEYVYKITVGGFTKEFTVTITGENELLETTVLLPYMSTDSTMPITTLKVDAVVNSESDASKTVKFGFYSKISDCYKLLSSTDYKFDIYNSIGTSIDYGAMGSFVKDSYTEKEMSLAITSISSQVVNKIALGTYTIVVTINEQEKEVKKTCKLQVIDTQKPVTISQYTNTVLKSWKSYANHTMSSQKDLILEYYNNVIAVDSNHSKVNDDPSVTAYDLIKGACYSVSDGERAWNDTITGFYLQYGIERSCKVTYDGKTYYAYDPRITFKSGVSGMVTQGSSKKVPSTNDPYPNPIQSATIGKLTIYLDVANLGTSGERSRLFVPFIIDNAGVSLTYTDEAIGATRFTISTEAVQFDKQPVDVLYMPNTDGFKLYMKLMDPDDQEVRNYANYIIASRNSEIVVVDSIDTVSHSVILTPVSDGTATLNLIDVTTNEVLKTIQIHVGTLDSSIYQLKLDQNTITLSNSAVTETKGLTMQLINQNTKQEEINWMPTKNQSSMRIKLKGGVKADQEVLTDAEIQGIQSIIDEDMLSSESISSANIVYCKERSLTFKGYSSNSLPVGTYQFEITSYGITAPLTVEIVAAVTEEEGEVTYSLVQDSMVVDLSTYDYTKSLENPPLTLKVVKKIGGTAVSYVDIASMEFEDTNLTDFYNEQYNELYVVNATKIEEDEMSYYGADKVIPESNSTFTVKFLDEDGEEQQLSGTIQIIGSYPVNVVQVYTTVNTLTLSDALQSYIWNTDAELGDDEKTKLEVELTKLVKENAYKFEKDTEIANGYTVTQYDHEYQVDAETGVIQSITFSNLLYHYYSYLPNDFHGTTEYLQLPEFTVAGPFTITFENNANAETK